MTQDDIDHLSKVLLSTFIIRKKRCRAYFHRGTLIWETERSPYTRWTLPLTDVIAASYGDEWLPGMKSTKKPNDEEVTKSSTSFVVHYAACGTKNTWSHHSVTMTHSDPKQVALWVQTIRSYLSTLTQRPRRILMFVNPFGGKKKGLQIWEKKVQPLMNIAGIDVKLIVTERAGHIKDTLLSTSLEEFQAVVCVGGDGTFSEVFNSLVVRTARDHHIDPNNIDAELLTPKIPVGIIPAGSTDTVVYSLHGTTDIQTATLHIIFGDVCGLDLSSVHTSQALLRLYASVLSYGYLGDLLQDSEKFRWMGPQRYDYSGFKKVVANKGYDCEIELLSDPCHPAISTRCLTNCSRCVRNKKNDGTNHEISRWMTIRGKFFMVNGANVSCACSRSPMGFSPHCHIGDGCVDVILVRHTSFFNNIRMLLRLSSKEKTVYDLPFVEVYRAREVKFRAVTQSSYEKNDNTIAPRNNTGYGVWNCDGEVVQSDQVKIRVHCQLLKIYTRRVPESTKESSCFCSL